ncbi:MAG: hypothetical protein M5U26_07815 [Planctomycetota bacterium]|nr:hypothetical protein [Planctomycetota bacterium]
MEKEPARRYVSAEALWEDLWRYRGGEPIHARAPSAFYRARKFMGRHRVWAALGALALAGAGAVAVWMPFHDRKVIEQVRTETEQEREAATARELRARLLALETRELGSALGERWRLVHALRLGGRPGDALDALDRLAKEQDAKSPESRAHIALWRALLEMDAGREGDLKEARKLAEDAGSPLLAGLCDLYLATPENLPAPPEHLDAEQRSIWCYHAGRVALARNRPAVARACFAHALDASIESLEARCAALELERLGGE